jgi:hypothetical protein
MCNSCMDMWVVGLVALLFAFPCYAEDANLSLAKTDPAAYLNQALDEMPSAITQNRPMSIT